ncbi:MAG TPA: SH3 domain-containing protein [Thermomicrobiales bacterium]|nr:SH3 domain-containing protein [Thermomicrobiales bacterium]
MTRGSRWRWLVAALLIVPALSATTYTSAALPAPPVQLTAVGGYCADGEENAFLGLINQYRAANGLGRLVHTQTLAAAAEHHSVDMATNNYFSHTMLDGTGVAQNLANHGYSDSSTWGENIAAGNASAAATFEQWRTSPGHNANMLNASFGAIGIGRASGGSSSYGTYWTTVFGATSDGAAAVCGAPPAAPTPSQPTSPPPSDAAANATTTAALNLRNGPSLGAAVLTVMPDGARVAVTGSAQGGFAPVTYGGLSGWAAMDYLLVDGQSPPAPAPADPDPNPAPSRGSMTVTEALNLRAGPNTSAAILTVMPAGARVEITGGGQNGFLPVAYNGVSGWAFGEFLNAGGAPPATPPPTTGAGTATVSADLNLRSGPGLDTSVLIVMPAGATVTLTGGSENGFLAVRYGGASGWAWAGYLATGGGTAPTGATRTVTTDLNLRTGQSLADSVILVMPPGGSVEITGAARNGFVPVRYNGTSGWAFREYLA